MESSNSHCLKDVVNSHEFKKWCESNTNEVFQSLFNTDLKSHTPNPKHNSNQEVSAVVAFMNEEVEAVLQLSCSRDTIVALVKHHYDDSFSETQSAFFLGEAVSIVFGMLKEKLNIFGLFYDKCLPLVISGQDHLILNLNDSKLLIQHYSTQFGDITLKIGLNEKKIWSKAAA